MSRRPKASSQASASASAGAWEAVSRWGTAHLPPGLARSMLSAVSPARGELALARAIARIKPAVPARAKAGSSGEPARKKYGASLTVPRQKLLDTYLDNHPEVQDWDDMPRSFQSMLEGGQPHESMWSDVNRYIRDRETQRIIASRGSFPTGFTRPLVPTREALSVERLPAKPPQDDHLRTYAAEWPKHRFGLEELPYSHHAPDVDPYIQDLQDSTRRITPVSILKDYGPHTGGWFDVYPAYVEFSDLPSPVLAEVEQAKADQEACYKAAKDALGPCLAEERRRAAEADDEDDEDDDGDDTPDCYDVYYEQREECQSQFADEEAGYDWSEIHSGGTFPAPKILVTRDGTVRILDGNHRLTAWENDYNWVQVWVIQAVRPPASAKKPATPTKKPLGTPAMKWEHSEHLMSDEGFVGGNWGSAGSGILFRAQDTGRVLLLLRSEWVHTPEVWGIPGGAIPRDTRTRARMDAYQSARKEALEETGIAAPSSHTGPRVQYTAPDGFMFTTFLVTLPYEARVRLNEEHDEATWVAPDQVEGMDLHPGLEAVWDELRALLP